VWTGEVPERLPASGDPLAALRTVIEELASEPLPGLPPLTGGMVGYLGYDIVRRLERLPELAEDDLQIPELVMLLATDLAAVDHHEGTITLIANAINWDASDERVDEAYDDAVARLDRMTADLAAPAPSTVGVYQPAEPAFTRRRTPAEHHAAVEAAKEQIRAGEAFQVVVAQRFEMPCPAASLDVYRVLRATNPSPYMYLLRLESAQGQRFDIVGSSPRRWSPCSTAWSPRTPSRARAGAAPPRRRTSRWRRTCAPTRRSAPSTSCSSTSGATTSAGSANPAR
jgi:anthranilate synthase component 1